MTEREQFERRCGGYIDQLSAHMDEGGKIGPNNVRDLIDMLRQMLEFSKADQALITHHADINAKWAQL